MKILHTSDWHLDARLEQCSRAEEHRRFFLWLRETLIAERVDALVVAGDVFDSGTPSNAAYLRYSEFLRDLFVDTLEGKSCCKNVIIVAGNHDSPSFLRTSGPILELLGTHVVTQPTPDLRDMIFPLKNADGTVACLCAAVPFLRERDVLPLVEDSESELERRVLLGFRAFYRKITDETVRVRDEILAEEGTPRRIPILATGHLFTARGRTLDDDGVRPIHVGTLDQFPASDFPEELDYVALGHLHVPQLVDGKEFIRYSGSPIPIGFSELTTPKRVILLETSEEKPFEIRELEVPLFRQMRVLRGETVEEIRALCAQLAENATEGEPIRVKVEFSGSTYGLNLNEEIETVLEHFPALELVCFENRTARERTFAEDGDAAALDDLKELDRGFLFQNFLNTMHSNLPDDERAELQTMFSELLTLFDSLQASGTEPLENTELRND